MTHLCDQLKAEEVSEYLRDVVDDGSHAEEGRGSPKVLQMPEEEGEDEPDTEAHEPSHEQEWGALQVFELLQDRNPLRHLSCCLGEHLSLKQK